MKNIFMNHFAKSKFFQGYKNFATKIKFSKPNFKWVYGGAPIILTGLLVFNEAMSKEGEEDIYSMTYNIENLKNVDNLKDNRSEIEKQKEKILKELKNKIPLDQILPLVIVYPRTENITKDLENNDAYKFDYDENFKYSTEEKEILRHSSISRHHIQIFIKETMDQLFPANPRDILSMIPDPTQFDYIVIQHYKTPVVIGTNLNTKNGKKHGYSIFIEITSVKQSLYNSIDKEIKEMRFEELKQLSLQSNKQWDLTYIASGLFIAASAVGTIGGAILYVYNMVKGGKGGKGGEDDK